jgi:hypothetical protein
MACGNEFMSTEIRGSEESRWLGKFHRKVFDYKFEICMGFPRWRGFEAAGLGDEKRDKEELDKYTHR